MVIIVASPDKLSISMFIDFYSHVYCQSINTVTKDLSCLYSSDVQEESLKRIISSNSESVIFIKYKIKPHTQINSIPDVVLNLSDFTICFKDLYSYKPLILKGNESDMHLNEMLMRWERNIEKLNALE